MSIDCPFCSLPIERKIELSLERVLALRDSYPVSEGHTLIVPKRHIATWFEATAKERAELWGAIDIVCEELIDLYSPNGFNFGINSGEAAGQTVGHLHLHVIPRYDGDMDDPRGGVRHVIPEMGNYKRDGYLRLSRQAREVNPPKYTNPISTSTFTSGPAKPLLPVLTQDISRARKLDIAVAFVYRSGLNRLMPRLEDLLEKEDGRLRILTGDYLNASDPDALQLLLDLQTRYPEKCSLFVYNVKNARSFHPKSYLMSDVGGENIAYVGSSNISHTALVAGIEWNYRIGSSVDKAGWSQASEEFELLLKDANVQPLDQEWLKAYRDRRGEEKVKPDAAVEIEPTYEVPTPHSIQQEALDALRKTREQGNAAGLVVLATGVGKTWLAAFDVASDPFKFERVLFLAHRKEILEQSLKTFRRINPNTSMGLYNGEEKKREADILFASVQTINRVSHLRNFSKDEFDYIVVDEFHHASASTYRRLIDYFQPKFMLGLTATPERTDGGDLLALCDENLVYRCDVPRAIELGLLCTYHYFGVPDSIDYRNIPWRSRKFDPDALTQAVETEERTQNIFEQWTSRGKDRTIAFCVSRSHANYMRRWFTDKGVQCAAVHSGSDSDSRTISLEKLDAGEIQVVFAIDMFNEGIDIPALDTVMMLRPTESSIVWLQQFGRGLRKQGDKVLTVIDYIGNHRSFILKLRALLNIQHGGDGAIRDAIRAIKENSLTLPIGCEVTYDLEAIDIMQALLRKSASEESALVQYYKDFREQHGQRPLASEAYHDGYLPSGARAIYGSWLELVEAMGDMDAEEKLVLNEHRVLLKGLEITSMSRSYKMVLLRALLNLDAMPGEGLAIDLLARGVKYLAERSERIYLDFGDAVKTETALKQSLVKNPVAAWTKPKALGGTVVFSYEESVFRYAPKVEPDHKEIFQTLVRELVEWRLATYLDGKTEINEEIGFTLKLSHSNGKPILFLPDRETVAGIPVGWKEVAVGEKNYFFSFKKVAVNVVADEKDGTNILPKLAREWFGPDAGLPGTNFRVRCEIDGEVLRMVPEIKEQDSALTPFKRYAREQIPKFFGEEFNPGKWRSGHIMSPTKNPEHIILLVTLEKNDMLEDHQYSDKFLSKDIFQWQSQNATTQKSNRGQQLENHEKLGLSVHLFIRKTKKQANRAAPFTYCGEVEFISWDGEKPITVQWRLTESAPDAFFRELNNAP